jgi:multiple sugar transport system substrate-binding protein
VRRLDRRRLLKLSGAGALAASSGGIAAILASGRAPAYAQATALHWLRWSDFVPASDQMLRAQIVPECEKALGIKLNLESINANDIQARITSAVQSGSGADIILVVNNWPQLYADSVVDVSDVAEAIGNAQGGYYEISKNVASDGKKWIGVPWSIGGGLLTNRKSWWDEIGYSEGKFPETWEEYRAAGKKLKTQSRPMGQSLGHTFGDPVVFWYPFLWSWGGKELEMDGKTVALNSKETVESVKFAVGFWKDAYDEGGLAWDDSSNNRAFLSGTCSSTNNGASIYLEAKKKPETYLTEKGAPLWKDIFPHPASKGPERAVYLPLPILRHGDGLFEESKGGQGVSYLGPLEAGLREVVHLAAGLHARPDRPVAGSSALAKRSGHVAVSLDSGYRARRRLCRAPQPRRGRGCDQVHHHRHVCEGGAGHAGRGRRQMGARRARQDLRLIVTIPPGV